MDVTRIASNIVTGVGFQGGGAIIKHGASVRGLTTAASMWVTAAVGLAVGLGGYFVAALSTAAMLLALALLRGPSRWIRGHAVTKHVAVIQLRPGADAGPVIQMLQSADGLDVRSITLRNGNSSGTTIEADLRGSDIETRLAPLARHEAVSDVDIGV